MDDARALLDELMGKDRNASEKGSRATHFSDPEICKYFICGFCPNELFINTKSDLGACKKKHDEACREEYQACSQKEKDKYPYERDFYRYLNRLIDELDRKIKKGLERIELDGPAPPIMNDKIRELTEQIQNLLQKVEDLAESGKIEESQRLIKVVDQLKAEKELALTHEMNNVSAQEKRMKVCEICGAFLVLGDTEKRVQSHIEGKQHQGYALIRKALEDNKKQLVKEEGERSSPPRRDDRERRDYRDDRSKSYRREDDHHHGERSRGHGDYRGDRRGPSNDNYRRRERDNYNDDDRDRKRHK